MQNFLRSIKDKIPFEWKYKTAVVFFKTARVLLFLSFFVSKRIASTRFAQFVFQRPAFPIKEKDSGGKRIIVFYDNLPTPDKDSASARMTALLEILSHTGKVVFVPVYYRFIGSEYEKPLSEMGIKIVSPIDFGHAFGNEAPEIAIFSYPMVANNFREQFTQKFSEAKSIFDTVDVHYVRLAREALLTGNSNILKESEDLKKIELRIVRKVDQTWCVTADDKNALLSEIPSANIQIIPNIHKIFGSSKDFQQRSDLLFIGGFRHRPNIDAVLFFAKEIFPKISEKRAEIRFHIVGSFPTPEVLSLGNDKIIVHGYLENVDEIFQSSRVFVSPLRYGGGMKGKIGQAMAYGLPVVTTAIGAEGMNLVNGETALIADAAEAFAEEVLRVYDDSLLWNRLSAGGIKHLEENLSPAAVAKKIETAFAGL